MKKVAICGTGMTKFGIRQKTQWREIAMEAARNTFQNVPLSPGDIDGLLVTSSLPERTAPNMHIAPWTAELIGAEPDKLACRVENLCASGNLGMIFGSAAIMSGMADLILVLGVEKLNVPHPQNARDEAIFNLGLTDKFELMHGFTPPSFFAQVAQRYDMDYGLTNEQRASVSEKNHRFGSNNPYAHYQSETPIEKVLDSPIVSKPLHLMECTPITDGGGGVLLASEKIAKETTDEPVYWLGKGETARGMTISSNKNKLHEWNLLRKASRDAYKSAGISEEKIDVACVHDCFTISEIIETEYLGFCEPGKGGKFAEEGMSDIGGKVVINPGGGLLSRGHPFGATGVAQVHEIFNQLRGTAENQVEEAEIGLTHNMSGYQGAHTINIFGVDT